MDHSVLAALAREPAVPFLPEVAASSTDPLLLITRRLRPGAYDRHVSRTPLLAIVLALNLALIGAGRGWGRRRIRWRSWPPAQTTCPTPPRSAIITTQWCR